MSFYGVNQLFPYIDYFLCTEYDYGSPGTTIIIAIQIIAPRLKADPCPGRLGVPHRNNSVSLSRPCNSSPVVSACFTALVRV